MPVDGVTFEDARPVLRAVSENVMLEIQKTFDFFKATAASDRIDRIMLSGGASRAEGFTEMLTERFEAPVEVFDPFKRVGVRREEVPGGVGGRRRADRGGRGRPRAAPGGRPMIRINLLAVERGRDASAARRDHSGGAPRHDRRQPDPDRHGARSSAGGSGRCGTTSHRLDEDIARGERETQQLRSVLAQVQKFEARKAQLQQRVTLIEQLRRGQSGPVHVLDEISKAIPDRLWLTELKQKGEEFTLGGMTTSLTGVSDFVANLETSAWFKKPVDIIDSQVEANTKTGDLVKFSVKATVQQPRSAAAAAAGAGGPAGPNGRPREEVRRTA